MRKLLLISFSLVLFACQSKKVLVENPSEPELIAPSWVQSTPISSLDYIGIGRASKIGPPEEYMLVARKSALNDLASQIEVTVTVNSLMHTLEHDDRFSESFSQQIDTRTELDLEGFEVYDSWENDDSYWVYYRLSKSDYSELKAQRKRNSTVKASNYLDLARQARSIGNVELAADYFTKTIVELQDYWGEQNVLDENESLESIDKIALEELMSMRNDYRLMANSDNLVLDLQNDFKLQFNVKSMLGSSLTAAVPFIYRIGRGERMSVLTNELKLTLRPGVEQRELLSITADPFQTVRSSYSGDGYAFLTTLLKEEVLQQEVEVYYPSFLVVAEEKRFGDPAIENSVLKGSMTSVLANRGIATKESSPYVIRLLANTRDAGMSQGFHVAYMDVQIEVVDMISGETMFSKSLPTAKGVHKTLEQAREKSQEKAMAYIDNNLLNALLDKAF